MNPQEIFDLLAKFAQDLLVTALPLLFTAGLVWLKAELKDRKIDEVIKRYAPVAVRAAEQLHLTGVIKDRKVYAIQFIQAIFDQRGVKVDAAFIANAVEAAVLQEFNWEKLIKDAPPEPAAAT